MTDAYEGWIPVTERLPEPEVIVRVRNGKWAPYHAFLRNSEWRAIEYNSLGRITHWMPKESP